MKTLRYLVAVGGLLFVPGLGHASPIVYYVETGQAGAQTQIDTNHTSTWDFSPTWAWDLGGGIFTMKEGSQTNGAITLSLTDLTDSIFIDSVTLDQTNFTQQFADVTFGFTFPDTLTPGINYELKLASNVPDDQNKAYFIKNGNTAPSFMDSQKNPLPAPAVPEPSSISLVAVGGVGVLFGSLKFRRGRSAAAPGSR